MSKLSHSNDETMNEIERRRRLADGDHCQCDACKDGNLHASDCAVHNMPAYPNDHCNCGATYTAPPSGVREGMLRAAEICKEWEAKLSQGAGYAIRTAREAITRAADQVNAEGRATQVPSQLSGKGDGTPSGSKKETTLNVSEPAPSAPDAGQVVVPEFTIDQFNRAAIIVGTMDGYEGASPDADHFNWLNAMLRAAGSRHE